MDVDTNEMRVLRKITGKTMNDRIGNESLRKM